MNIQLVPTPVGEASYLMFTTTFSVEEHFFKMMVAENLFFDGDPTGGYTVVLISYRSGTESFHIHKDEDDRWVSETCRFSEKLITAIGGMIEEAYKMKPLVLEAPQLAN